MEAEWKDDPPKAVAWIGYGMKFECGCGRVMLATDDRERVHCPTCHRTWLVRVAIFDITPHVAGQVPMSEVVHSVERFLRESSGQADDEQ